MNNAVHVHRHPRRADRMLFRTIDYPHSRLIPPRQLPMIENTVQSNIFCTVDPQFGRQGTQNSLTLGFSTEQNTGLPCHPIFRDKMIAECETIHRFTTIDWPLKCLAKLFQSVIQSKSPVKTLYAKKPHLGTSTKFTKSTPMSFRMFCMVHEFVPLSICVFFGLVLARKEQHYILHTYN